MSKRIINCKCGRNNAEDFGRGLCSSCYAKVWRFENPEYNYKGKRASYYLYMYLDVYENIIYIGSTRHKTRFTSDHFGGNSSLYMDYTDWKKTNLKTVLYLEIDKNEFTEDNKELARDELYYFERLLMEREGKGVLNKEIPFISKKLSISRLEELEWLFEQIDLKDFDEYELSDRQKEKLGI